MVLRCVTPWFCSPRVGVGSVPRSGVRIGPAEVTHLMSECAEFLVQLMERPVDDAQDRAGGSEGHERRQDANPDRMEELTPARVLDVAASRRSHLRSAVERGSGTRPGIRTQVRGLRLAPRAVNA